MRDSDLFKYNSAQDFYTIEREKDGRWRVWTLDGEPVTRPLHRQNALRRRFELRVRLGLNWMKDEHLNKIIRRELKRARLRDWRRICDEYEKMYRFNPDYDLWKSAEISAAGGNNIIMFPRLSTARTTPQTSPGT